MLIDRMQTTGGNGDEKSNDGNDILNLSDANLSRHVFCSISRVLPFSSSAGLVSALGIQ